MEGKGVEMAQLELLNKKLLKSERMRQQMKHQMGEQEDEVNRWKGKMQDAIKEKDELIRDNELLKDEVVKQGIALKEIAQNNWELKEWLRLNVKK
jgi:hypothetical protein